MCRRFGPPSQGWRTFLSNHADGIAAVDLFVLPTITFQTLYCLVILRHGRRFWMSFDVTSNPTAEWISRQIVCRQSISDSWLGNLRECLAHLV